jgi:hypothetical protein
MNAIAFPEPVIYDASYIKKKSRINMHNSIWIDALYEEKMMSRKFQEDGITAKTLMESACAATGLNDFGNEWFVPHLQKMLDAFDHEANFNEPGKAIMNDRLESFLATRLRFIQELNRHPEILEQKIDAPIVIIGLPRTGTTKLHRMMCASEDFQCLKLWQALQPIAPQRGAEQADNRRQAGLDYVEMLKQNAPEILAVHEMEADWPEEEIMLMQHSFVTKVVYTEVHVPSFLEHVDASDVTPVYEELRDWLKYLQWQTGESGKRWLLKCVYHNEFLTEFLSVFPDAKLVQLHRKPESIIGSWSSLTDVFRRIYTDEHDPKEIGPDMVQFWSDINERYLAIRDANPNIEVRDFLFTDVVSDIEKVISEIYAFAGLEPDEESWAKMRSWEAANQRHKHGKHEYTLEQFGTDEKSVRDAFGDYCQRYDV